MLWLSKKMEVQCFQTQYGSRGPNQLYSSMGLSWALPDQQGHCAAGFPVLLPFFSGLCRRGERWWPLAGLRHISPVGASLSHLSRPAVPARAGCTACLLPRCFCRAPAFEGHKYICQVSCLLRVINIGFYISNTCAGLSKFCLIELYFLSVQNQI